MVALATPHLKNVESKRKVRRYRHIPRTPIEFRHNIFAPLSWEAVDRLGLDPEHSQVIETIDGDTVILRFKSRENQA